MIEVHNVERTLNIGRFVNFKAAKDTLDSLAASGKLSGENPSVLVRSYKNGKMMREYIAVYQGKWRVPKLPKACPAVNGCRKKARKVKKHWCKIYKSPVECFREGFPVWQNRTYQPVR